MFDAGPISSGFSSPFFVGCQLLTRLGNFAAKDVETDLLNPEQYGQPAPRLLRLLITASHSWEESRLHFHQTFFPDLAVKSLGVRFPFNVGCHSFASVGKSKAREFSFVTLLPLQYGQPYPVVLWSHGASHECFLAQSHQTFVSEPAVRSSGLS